MANRLGSRGLRSLPAGTVVGRVKGQGAPKALNRYDLRQLGIADNQGPVNNSVVAASATSAASADKWTTGRTVTFTGGATGSFTIDGSANVSCALTVAGGVSSVAASSTTADLSITGSPITSSGTFSFTVNSAPKWTTARTLSFTGDATGSGSVDGSANVATALTLATVTVSKGGTGDTTLAAHGVLVGNGTSAVSVTGTGTSGQVLTSTGASSDPTFQSPTTGAMAPLTILKRSTAQTYTNNVWAAVSWDTTAVQDDVTAFASGTPTYVTVPSGYTRVRITMELIWANNGTNSRYLSVCKNGTADANAIVVNIKSANNEQGHGHITRWLTVAAGDKLYIRLLQASGGNLNLTDPTFGTGGSYVQFEWVP